MLTLLLYVRAATIVAFETAMLEEVVSGPKGPDHIADTLTPLSTTVGKLIMQMRVALLPTGMGPLGTEIDTVGEIAGEKIVCIYSHTTGTSYHTLFTNYIVTFRIV